MNKKTEVVVVDDEWIIREGIRKLFDWEKYGCELTGEAADGTEAIAVVKEKNPDILQIELEFVEGNTRARALYEKMGFRITGVKPNAIRLKDGALLNEYSMVRKIKRQPSALSKT